MVASAIRSCSSSPTRAPPARSSTAVIDGLSPPRFPRVAELLADAEPDLLAHFAFPETHRRQIRSTNPLERLNKEIKRRTAVVGIFPNRASRHPPRRDDPRRAGRRVAGRPALLPARDDGADRRRRQNRGGEPSRCCSRADRSGARTTRCYTTCWDLVRRAPPDLGRRGQRIRAGRRRILGAVAAPPGPGRVSAGPAGGPFIAPDRWIVRPVAPCGLSLRRLSGAVSPGGHASVGRRQMDPRAAGRSPWRPASPGRPASHPGGWPLGALGVPWSRSARRSRRGGRRVVRQARLRPGPRRPDPARRPARPRSAPAPRP